MRCPHCGESLKEINAVVKTQLENIDNILQILCPNPEEVIYFVCSKCGGTLGDGNLLVNLELAEKLSNTEVSYE